MRVRAAGVLPAPAAAREVPAAHRAAGSAAAAHHCPAEPRIRGALQEHQDLQPHPDPGPTQLPTASSGTTLLPAPGADCLASGQCWIELQDACGICFIPCSPAAAILLGCLWKAITDQRAVLQVFTALYNTDDNCLVAAPTGSGKTACAEFAVLRMIHKASQDKGAARCVYIAPLPGLARERMADWSAKVRLLHSVSPLTMNFSRA